MNGLTSLSTLDALLAPPKARLARRFLMRGEALTQDAFAQRGQPMSAEQWNALCAFADDGMATRVHARSVAGDGTVKFVLRLRDGETIETVAMPTGTVCVSTQVGCAVRCRFCASGRDGLIRNLSADEIVEQLVHARREMPMHRVVYMGMGEPTHNLDAVLDVVARIRRDAGIGFRKQTLSTVGSLRALERLQASDAKPCLAFSLHSADERTRRDLLPNASRDPLADLVAAADGYARTMGIPVQFEWTFLEGVNDRDEDVEQLAGLLRGVRGYVNFIVWNRVDDLPFAPTPRARVVELVRRVKAHGIFATIRDSAGADADAACGQLRRRT
jgi:23S rRNA (adenine2503-C2)-methyltransferase